MRGFIDLVFKVTNKNGPSIFRGKGLRLLRGNIPGFREELDSYGYGLCFKENDFAREMQMREIRIRLESCKAHVKGINAREGE